MINTPDTLNKFTEGYLLINKPPNWTSFDVVNYVRKMFANLENKKPKRVKVGHAGTLDPLATGLLILLIGKNYTKRASYFSKLPKTYTGIIRLGMISSTGDEEGVKEVVSSNVPDLTAVEQVFNQFEGDLQQLPPIYSAIKVQGQRAYRLARKGQVPELKARPVTIYKLRLRSYDYPDISFTAEVSAGTYIRSLAVDIGEALGCGAYLKELSRQSIGQYNLTDALSVSALTPDSLRASLKQLSELA